MRRTASFLSAVLLLGGLAACGGDDGSSDDAADVGTPGECSTDRLVTTQAVRPEGGGEPAYRIVVTDDTIGAVAPITEGGNATDPTFSPDGTRVAYVQHVGALVPHGFASTIWTVGADGSDPTRITGGADWSDDPAAHTSGSGEDATAAGPHDIEPDWSPTEDRIVFTHVSRSGPSADAPLLRRLYTVVPGQEPELLLDDPAAQGFAPAWSPDGAQVAFLRGDRASGILSVWVVGKDGARSRKVADTGDASELLWSPDGRTLQVGGQGPRGASLALRNIDVATGAAVAIASSGVAMAWSDDGQRLFVVARADVGTAAFNDVLTITRTADGQLQVDSRENELSLFQRPDIDGLDVTACPG